MSAIFQRPLCDMGRAYDYALRPAFGDPPTGSGGGCDDRPHRVEIFAASADPSREDAPWQPFSLCPEHESQLREIERSRVAAGTPSRFRPSRPGPSGHVAGNRA